MNSDYYNSNDFFIKHFESTVNERMLEYDFSFPERNVLNYIKSVTAVPITEFLDEEYLLGHDIEITAADLLQFSSLEDATENICFCYKKEDNPGFNAEETGKLLLNTEDRKSKLAYRKYGENHAKAAEALGLVYSISNIFFLSCIGMEFNTLDKKVKEKLLLRLILRTREISQLYRQYRKNKKISAREYMGMLSDSTYKRRRSNLRRLLRVLAETDEYDFSEFLNSIVIE